MKRLALLLAAASVSTLLLAGVALAATVQCKTTANDRDCTGTQRADTLLGTDKFETINGRGGPDTIKSFAGGDTVYGENGDDDLFAGEGEDSVYPGPGDDTIRGGKGYDEYVFNDYSGRDTITEERGSNNAASITNRISVAPLVVDLDSSATRPELRNASGTQTIDWANDAITSVGITSQGADTIRGNEKGTTIGSYSGSDAVYGMGGDDSIFVADDAGDDTVDCGPGDNDKVYPDPGDTVRNCEVRRDL